MAPCPGGNLAQAGCFLSIRKTTIFELMGWLKEIGSGWGLHPLIHALLKFNLSQDTGTDQNKLHFVYKQDT
jgi:hypothetical protein